MSNWMCKLRQQAMLGIFMKTSDSAFVEIAGFSNMDFVILDMEHGPVNLTQMQNNIRAAQLSGLRPFIRVAECNEVLIGQALDIGAAGIQIPQISTAGQAKMAVEAAKFYPEGRRGVCRFVRAAQYSRLPRESYFQQANNTEVIIQLEGCEAIKQVNEIIQVPGIDIVFIGPYDLSQSLGFPGQVTHPLVLESMQKIVNCCAEKGIVTGTFTDTPEQLKLWLDAGVHYLVYSVDVGLFSECCTYLVDMFGQLQHRSHLL